MSPSKTLPNTMQAWRTHEYGEEPHAVLKLDELEIPTPGPGELLVRVQAIPLNLNDLERVTGRNMMVRPELPCTPGMEVMGTVAVCGPDLSSSMDPSPLHTYTSAGTYTVVLTTTGPAGVDSETKVDYITVSEPPPVADFSADVLSGTAPLVVQFTDESTGGLANQWSWSFGDLGTSTLEDPEYTYLTPGVYTVTLAATGPGGTDLEVKSGYIVVN